MKSDDSMRYIMSTVKHFVGAIDESATIKVAHFIKIKLLFFVCLVTSSCNDSEGVNTNSQRESTTDSEIVLDYPDGTYCAEVEYYYSKTGTNSTYTLSVEIEESQLVRINWPNGGWLDDSHFDPPEIEDGTAEFTSDKGVDYTIRILGEEGDCGLSSDALDEESLVDEQREAELQEELDEQEVEDRLREEDELEASDREEEERQAEEELELSEEETLIHSPEQRIFNIVKYMINPVHRSQKVS